MIEEIQAQLAELESQVETARNRMTVLYDAYNFLSQARLHPQTEGAYESLSQAVTTWLSEVQ